MTKRIFSLAGVLLIVSCLVLSTAATGTLDLNRKGSVSVTMTCEGTAVPGGTMTAYRVAEIVPAGAGYTYRYLEAYQDCTVPVSDPSFPKIAEALAVLIQQKGYEGTTKSISENGEVSFTELDTGLYLLLQENAPLGYYPVNPFLVSIPGRDDQDYVYDVDASPKVAIEKKPEETEPSTEPTSPTTPTTPGTPHRDPNKLPQTGQLNWPVPLLAGSGLVIFFLGWLLYRSGRKAAYEM